jgi:hypothetical protein
MLTAAKLSIFDLFQEIYYPGMARECPVKMSLWQSVLYALAIELCCLLE